MNAPICAGVVTITLQAIKDADPCCEGWNLVLKSRGPNPDYATEFPLADIITSNCLEHAIWALRCVDKIYAKRFAIECAKMVLHLMKDQRSIDAVAMAERYVDGHATLGEFIESRRNAAAYADAAAAAAACAAYAAAAAAAARTKARKEMRAKQNAALRVILGEVAQ